MDPTLPTRPMLRPGVRVVRRDARHFQVGLDPAHALVVPDDPDVSRLLGRLTVGGLSLGPETLPPRTLRLCRELAGRGLILDADTLLTVLPAVRPGSDERRRAVAALFAEVLANGAGGAPAAAGYVGRRSRARVRVHSIGAGLPVRLGERVVELLAYGGLRAVLVTNGLVTNGPATDRLVSQRQGDANVVDPDAVGLLLAVGEPDRAEVDRATRSGLPHLILRVVEGNVLLGPFVVPGTTACLRCIDAHHTEYDPRHGLVVAQYAATAGRDREDGVPEPVDPFLLTVGLGWAARELATFVQGQRPATWSATARMAGATICPDVTPWLRHPGCGCSWDESLPRPATLGA